MRSQRSSGSDRAQIARTPSKRSKRSKRPRPRTVKSSKSTSNMTQPPGFPNHYSEDDLFPRSWLRTDEDLPYREIKDVCLLDVQRKLAVLHTIEEEGPFIMTGNVRSDLIEAAKLKKERDWFPMCTYVFEWNLEFHENKVVHWLKAKKSWWRVLSCSPEYLSTHQKTVDMSDLTRYLIRYVICPTEYHAKAIPKEINRDGSPKEVRNIFTVIAQSVVDDKKHKNVMDVLEMYAKHREFYLQQLINVEQSNNFLLWALEQPTYLTDLIKSMKTPSKRKVTKDQIESRSPLNFQTPLALEAAVWQCPVRKCAFASTVSPDIPLTKWFEKTVVKHLLRHADDDRNLRKELEETKVLISSHEKRLEASVRMQEKLHQFPECDQSVAWPNEAKLQWVPKNTSGTPKEISLAERPMLQPRFVKCPGDPVARARRQQLPQRHSLDRRQAESEAMRDIEHEGEDWRWS